jgi:hypothetical protein
VEPFDALSLCGEVAIAVTGFSGVVLVFGERGDRGWSEVDRVRFRMLFTGTFHALGLIALAFVLGASGLEPAAAWRVCSVAYFLAASTTAFLNVRAAARADAGDPDLRVPRFDSIWRGGAAALGCAMLVLLLQLANAIALHAFWPVLVAAWWAIALSLFAFVGLLFPRLRPEESPS